MPKLRIKRSPAVEAAQAVSKKRRKEGMAELGRLRRELAQADAALKNQNLGLSERAKLQKIRDKLAINFGFVQRSLANKMKP